MVTLEPKRIENDEQAQLIARGLTDISAWITIRC
jgi:hypothetical protein